MRLWAKINEGIELHLGDKRVSKLEVVNPQGTHLIVNVQVQVLENAFATYQISWMIEGGWTCDCLTTAEDLISQAGTSTLEY